MDEIMSENILFGLHIREIVDKLDEDAKFLSEAQEDLRAYVTNKHFSLSERFRVWSLYCDKNHKYIIHEHDMPICGKYVDDNPECFGRYQTETYKYFLDVIDRDRLNELKEELIDHNFGSFIYDW